MSGRVVAFDLGDRRIGVAVSDPTRTIAQGRETILRDGATWPWRKILAVIEETAATQVVVGDPLHFDGSTSERSRTAGEFAQELRMRSGLPVDLEDERCTSVEAERMLAKTGRGRRRRDRGDVDRAAAILILQDWLDARDGEAT
ncbi:MAG: Holliday junction resolvase RuvX [Gemmatimonadetes bacterium]|nr:Holliday junction resolvase RuvX [Gemmatimonadota bacterium]